MTPAEKLDAALADLGELRDSFAKEGRQATRDRIDTIAGFIKAARLNIATPGKPEPRRGPRCQGLTASRRRCAQRSGHTGPHTNPRDKTA